MNGGFVKGEITELMPGEYLVIRKLDGETRRFEWSEVASVEHGQGGTTTVPKADPVPVEPAEPPPEPVAEGPQLSRETPFIHIELDRKDRRMSLSRVTGRAVAVGSGGSASAVGWDRVCTAPCDRLIEEPDDEFFIEGAKLSASRPFELGTDSKVYELKVRTRGKGMIIGGWVLATVGSIAFINIALIPLYVNMKFSDAGGLWAVSGIGFVGSLAGGFTMMKFGRTKVEVFRRDAVDPAWVQDPEP